MRVVERRPTSVTELIAQLRELGVREGDLLMLHASLRRVGPVEGDALGLIAALQQAVGPGGTLVMILGAELEWFTVNEAPTEPLSALLERTAPFDPLGVPAQRDVGVLAEVFRQAPGVIVTSHPDGRFAAWGARARELLRDDPWDHYYGPGSVLERLVEGGGRVLRLGADLETATVLHYAEYLTAVPHKRERTLYFLVEGSNGPEVRGVHSLDNEHGIVDWRGNDETDDYFAAILRAYLAEGHGRRGPIGGAQSELLEARHLVTFGARWMETHLAAES